MEQDHIDYGGWRNRRNFMDWVRTYYPRVELRVAHKLSVVVKAKAEDILAECRTEPNAHTY
jgi:hypothetical protein